MGSEADVAIVIVVDVGLVLLRIVHIGAGAFWVGSAFVFALLIEPTAAAVGPNAAPFMAHLTQKKRFPVIIAISSVVTILAGTVLYWRVSGGLSSAWITSPIGIGFTVGAAAAISSFVVGFTVLRPAIDQLGALAQAAGQGAAPGDAQRKVERLQHRVKTGGMVNLLFLTVAVTAMASARYL